MERAAVGIAEHGGWASLVTVTLGDGGFEIVDRRRVELIEPNLPNQPYHHETLEMAGSDADTLVTLVKASVAGEAAQAFEDLSRDLEGHCAVCAIAIRTPPIDALPATVAEVHASRRIMTAADGMIYHEALCNAALRRGWQVVLVARRTELERAAQVLGSSPQQAEAAVDRAGKALGSPWDKEHGFAAAAAIAALGPVRLRSAQASSG